MHSRFAAALGLVLFFASFLSSAEGASFRTLHTFCTTASDCRDGLGAAQLVADNSGNVFGAAWDGGAYHGHGVIYELVGGIHFKVLYTFCKHGLHHVCPDGETPRSPLVVDTSGNLYGVTSNGGAYGSGTAFKLSPDGTLTTLHDFCGSGDPACSGGGSAPSAGLAYAGAIGGTLYDGTSPLFGVFGGSTNAPGAGGAVFELVSGTPWTTALVYQFCQQGGVACTDGAGSFYTLVVDDTGNIFGDTAYGGGGAAGAGGGTVFEIQPSGGGWTETVLHSFCTTGWPLCADGYSPMDHVTLDSSGNIYGTTISGGRQCRSAPIASETCGVLYKIVPNGTSSVETVLRTFCAKDNCTDGGQPVGGVAVDASGKIYGTTQFGGGNSGVEPAGPGVLFAFDGGTYRVVHRFCAAADCSDGQLPQTAPILAPDGMLYGQSDLTTFHFRPMQ